MTFIADDILNWIDTQDNLVGTLFLSIGTSVLLPRDFLIEMFRLLSSKDCSQIMLFEPYGLSRDTNDLPTWNEGSNVSSSLLYRDTMYLHDYQGIGYSNGFILVRRQLLKTQHQDDDYRIEYVSLVDTHHSD